LGWFFGLLGVASLIPLLLLAIFWLAVFLSLDPSSTPGLRVRGGPASLVIGPLVTVLLFRASSRLLHSPDRERRIEVLRGRSTTVQ
jgi:hypothetical protein